MRAMLTLNINSKYTYHLSYSKFSKKLITEIQFLDMELLDEYEINKRLNKIPPKKDTV